MVVLFIEWWTLLVGMAQTLHRHNTLNTHPMHTFKLSNPHNRNLYVILYQYALKMIIYILNQTMVKI